MHTPTATVMPHSESPWATALVKRFVYDLHEVMVSLNLAGGYPVSAPAAKAWILEHLRSYHYIDVDEFPQRISLIDLDARGGRVTAAITRQLYKLFHPMSIEATNACFTDVTFKNEVLTVSIYDYR